MYYALYGQIFKFFMAFTSTQLDSLRDKEHNFCFQNEMFIKNHSSIFYQKR